MSQAPDTDLLALTQRVVDRADRGEHVEAFAVRQTDTTVEVLDRQVDALSSAETRGLGVRVIRDGRQGYAYTAVTTDAGLAEALDEARSNAAVAMPDEANLLPGVEAPAAVEGLTDPDFGAVSIERKIELALALEESARDADARVTGVESAQYADTEAEMALASTAGLALTQRRTDAFAYVFALAREGDETQSGLGLTLARGPADLDVAGAGREAATKAGRLLGARKPRSKRTAVVFDPFVTAQFLGVLGQALSAEAVLKGRSLFAERIGEKVAADHLRLLDDGRYPGAPGTAPWDGEGVPQQTTSLVDGGVLQTFLHNTWTAARTGGGARSTGNAARSGFKSSPGLAPSNLYLDPGGLGPDDILAQAGEGVYVQDVMGLHSGANPISGEFSVSFSGLAIADGKLGDPIREAAVSSTIVDVLTGIRAVGNDLRFFPFGGSLGGSTVLVGEMSVSGD